MVISQNIVIVNFLFNLVTFQSGIMAFLTSIYIVARKPIYPCKQNKERTYGLLHPPKIAHTDLTKSVNDCVSRNGCRINTTKSNQVILVSFFSEDNVYLMKSKYAIFSNIKVTKIKRSTFFGTPGIH